MAHLKTYGEVIEGDLRNEASLRAAVRGATHVIHAGGGGFLWGLNRRNAFEINELGTRNLLNACLRWAPDPEKFVYVSSCVVMGDCAGGPFIKGDPARVSGVTPMLMILKNIVTGDWRYLGNEHNLVHFIHIRNAVQGLKLAAAQGRAGQVYIIADARSWRVKEMVDMAAAELGAAAPTGTVPPTFALLMAYLYELKAMATGGRPELSREMVRGLTIDRTYLIDKARVELGYEAVGDFPAGIKEVVYWYKANGYL